MSHQYGQVRALDGIDLDIPGDRMVGLIGPDGVGKSSLLALLAGARRLQTGRVIALDHDLGDRHARADVQPRIAYMPQGLGRNLYPTLSVQENVDFFARLFGQAREERGQRIGELLESTGLAQFRERPAAKLSGGMKQKLSLCCALIHDPDLLILDEPTTGVDPLSRRQFWRLIERIRGRRAGMSVVVATAYMEEAGDFDWLVAMDGGRILGTGSPDEVKARTGSPNLDAAFIALLPEEKRRRHVELVIPPRVATEEAPAIETRDLTKRFGKFTAVDGVTIRIERGEIFGFLGSNGCGKTTTMKMLTGLLPPSSGEARLFGQPVSGEMEARRDVGYMSQAFSLYGELTVMQNLELHARIFNVEGRQARIAELVERFGLTPYREAKPESLPLGIRQRLSLAVAVVHSPRLLILDEPTSGVDPVARDDFWALLVELARQQGVTIFVSTHFMNEAERCDRISLMHAGRILASEAPAALVKAKGAKNLEGAFIAYLEEAAGGSGAQAPESAAAPAARAQVPRAARAAGFSLMRMLAYAQREGLELRRDRFRLTFALAGTVLMMFVLGYGISLDVENLPFAVLDYDETPESRDYVRNIAGSRYFTQQAPLKDYEDMERQMAAGRIALALEVPPRFGLELRSARSPRVSLWVDGAMPFRGETARGYAEQMHRLYVADLVEGAVGERPAEMPVEVQTRYRYNQAFRSVNATVPAVISLLLIFFPCLLTALGVVREKELGSITNLYVTPVTRFEFLSGKQLPYIALALVSMVLLVVQAVFIFRVPLTGSLVALFALAVLYVLGTTGIGLLISTVTNSQMAALAAASILTITPTIQFSGIITPVSSLEGMGAWFGKIWPPTHYVTACRGVFNKALGFRDLGPEFLALALVGPLLIFASAALLPKQEK